MPDVPAWPGNEPPRQPAPDATRRPAPDATQPLWQPAGQGWQQPPPGQGGPPPPAWQQPPHPGQGAPPAGWQQPPQGWQQPPAGQGAPPSWQGGQSPPWERPQPRRRRGGRVAVIALIGVVLVVAVAVAAVVANRQHGGKQTTAASAATLPAESSAPTQAPASTAPATGSGSLRAPGSVGGLPRSNAADLNPALKRAQEQLASTFSGDVVVATYGGEAQAPQEVLIAIQDTGILSGVDPGTFARGFVNGFNASGGRLAPNDFHSIQRDGVAIHCAVSRTAAGAGGAICYLTDHRLIAIMVGRGSTTQVAGLLAEARRSMEG